MMTMAAIVTEMITISPGLPLRTQMRRELENMFEHRNDDDIENVDDDDDDDLKEAVTE